MKNKKVAKQSPTSNTQNSYSNTTSNVSDDTQNKSNNAKKVGMGPNTNR